MKLPVHQERRRSPNSQFSSRRQVGVHKVVNLVIGKAAGELFNVHHASLLS